MIRFLLVKLIRLYQWFSKYTIKHCRFEPTCSQYSILALEKYGLFKGLFKSIVRVSKCHPYHSGGYDPV